MIWTDRSLVRFLSPWKRKTEMSLNKVPTIIWNQTCTKNAVHKSTVGYQNVALPLTMVFLSTLEYKFYWLWKSLMMFVYQIGCTVYHYISLLKGNFENLNHCIWLEIIYIYGYNHYDHDQIDPNWIQYNSPYEKRNLVKIADV